MKIVLIGAGGKLGRFLQREWEPRHEVRPLTRTEVNLRDGAALQARLEDMEFEAVVNCAALASPEACEADREEARLVNVVAPGLIASACAARGARFVHFSTDYAVDGREAGLKDEETPGNDLGIYGRTKVEGERRVLEADADALVCRVSWVFGEGIPSFLETVVGRARRGEVLEAVGDKWSKPTSARDIADSVERLLPVRDASGLLHLVNQGEPVSWWDYAVRAVELAVEAGVLSEPVEVRRKTLSEVPQLSAPRPVHTGLSSIRQEALLGTALPSWEDRALGVLDGATSL